MNNVYFHVDLDSFFASVEQLDNPQYRGKPVIVGGLPSDRRSVVSTASYEARKFGVHSAMPSFKAYKLCPQGIFLRGRMNRYFEKSHEVMTILNEYSPDVIQMSIDEAFLIMTGTEKLFGNPIEVAKELKTNVKKRTGLTISVGIASTMYLAKVASGLNKPDGLTVIPPQETKTFMQSLPLEKIWGIGTKTLEHIKKSGFTTTSSLYSKQEILLQSIFGENTGSFIYNALRGNEKMIFGKEAKNHSISSETTFEYDLTERYVIDTSFLELSQIIMFRMHREHKRSRTLALKIRYEDFTTVSIQETRERPFSSADDLFESCVRLFTKKYETGRSIRLLGITVSNVEDNSIPSQKELFEDKENKKSIIEKAIMSFEDKHPGTKITKARMLTKNISIIISFLILLNATRSKLYSENIKERDASGAGSIVFSQTTPSFYSISDYEAPISLFNYDINDSNIEFLASGFWQTDIIGSLSSTFGNGSSFTLSAGVPVFSQTVDLSLYFLLNKKWYFESSFADEFTKNMVAAGYLGNGILKHVKIANRGIIFPSIYTVTSLGKSIGGGDNSAPGIMFHLEDTKWSADAVVRYDMLNRKSKLFSGMNIVTTTAIDSSKYVTGRQFILPTTDNILSVKDIYVENNNGTYKDKNNRKYQKLNTTQYILIPTQNKILLSEDAGSTEINSIKPAVIITFNSVTDYSTITNDIGEYNNINTYLGKIQSLFSLQTSINLEKYSNEIFTKIDGENGVYLQYPSSFSPFASCSFYDGGLLQESDILVTDSSSGTVLSSYTAVQTDLDTSISQNYFSDKHLWITVSSNKNDSLSEFRKLFPFADVSPFIYLNSNKEKNIQLELKTYTPVTDFNIGTDAVDGTISVFVNNNVFTGAVYNNETGIVNLLRPVNNTDRIYITWSEDSSTSDDGALASAIGFIYNFTPSFSSDISITSRWPISSKQYSDSISSSQGFTSLTTNLSYKKNNFNISNTIALSIDNMNTTGYYRILSMDDKYSGDNYYNSYSSGVNLPINIEPSLNLRDNTNIFLNKEYRCSVEQNPIQDSTITGYKIPVSWNFSSLSQIDETAWSVKTINLGTSGETLRDADSFSIAVQCPIDLKGYNVYLQLGVSSLENFSVEDTKRIPTWLVSKSSLIESNPKDVEYAIIPGIDASIENTTSQTHILGNGWQEIKVNLTDYDKSLLLANYNARLIITAPLTNRNDLDFPISGLVYLGPWSVENSAYQTSYNNSIFTLKNIQQTDSSLTNQIISDFNKSNSNTVDSISWFSSISDSLSLTSSSDTIISTQKSFSEIDISSYKELSLYFCYKSDVSIDIGDFTTENYALNLVLDRPSQNGVGIPCITTQLSSRVLDKYITTEDKYHKLTIDLKNRTLSIDGNIILEEDNTVFIDNSIIPTRFTLSINTYSSDSNKFISKGTFSFDELYLSQNSVYISALDKLSASYTKEGTFLSINNYPLLSDFTLTTSSIGNISSTKEQSYSSINKQLTTDGNISLTLMNISIQSDISASFSDDSNNNTQATQLIESTTSTNGITTAGYSISSTKPILGLLSFKSSFRSIPSSKTGTASSNISLSLAQFKLPITFSFSTQSNNSIWIGTQKSTASITLNTSPYNFNLETGFSQKLTQSDNSNENTISNDFINSQSLSFSTGDFNALKRTTYLSINNILNFNFLSLKPQLSLTSSAITAQSLFNDSTETILSIPFKTNIGSFAFSWTKKSNGVSSYNPKHETSAYLSDTLLYGQLMQSRSWYFLQFPFMDLFNKDLGLTMESNLFNLYTISYIGAYTLSWKRMLLNSFTDLFIPSSTTLSFTRDIKSAGTITDYYQTKLDMNFSALNMFGTLGTYSYFSWYQQDSLLSSLGALIKTPHDKPEDTTLTINGYSELNFFLNKDGILRIGSEGDFSNLNNWGLKNTISWQRNGIVSPLFLFTSLFIKKLDCSKILCTRTDSINMALSKRLTSTVTDSSSITKISISISHLLNAKVTKFLEINSTLSTTFEDVFNTISSLNLTASIGGKVTF